MKSSRRKFIATAFSGTVASVVAPVAFASKQQEQTVGQITKDAFVQKPAVSTPKRVVPSSFIIFPWGGMPDRSGGTWAGDPMEHGATLPTWTQSCAICTIADSIWAGSSAPGSGSLWSSSCGCFLPDFCERRFLYCVMMTFRSRQRWRWVAGFASLSEKICKSVFVNFFK